MTELRPVSRALRQRLEEANGGALPRGALFIDLEDYRIYVRVRRAGNPELHYDGVRIHPTAVVRALEGFEKAGGKV